MITKYDPNFAGTHVIRITFLQWEYSGHVAFRIGGNCKGANILECFDSLFDCDDFTENDCDFAYDEEYEVFYLTLTNESGTELQCEGDENEIRDMIVGIEIAEILEKTK